MSDYYQPYPVSGKHKYAVRVWDPDTQQDKTIFFGHSDYEDYTQHHDEKRRQNYLSRSAGIHNNRGELTKDDPRSANYWSRRYLWASDEPWYIYLPPNMKYDGSNVISLQ